MEFNYMKIIETIIVVVVYIILRKLFLRIINKNLSRRLVHESRGVVVKKAVNITFRSIFVILILLVWGVKQADLAVFVGSVITVVGVAFFAQWSILSNITSSIIIFFNHSIKLNDSIVIMEGKDYVIEGKVVDIGLFFVILLTEESEEISLPNNVFIQKSIKRKVNQPVSTEVKKLGEG